MKPNSLCHTAFKPPSNFVDSSDLTMMSADESSQVHAKPRELFAEEKKAGPPPFMKEHAHETTGIYEIAFFRQRNRGFRQFVSAQKVRRFLFKYSTANVTLIQIITIGDLCQLSEQQIAKFPLSNPVPTIRSAIREHFAKVEGARYMHSSLTRMIQPRSAAEPLERLSSQSSQESDAMETVVPATVSQTPKRHPPLLSTMSLLESPELSSGRSMSKQASQASAPSLPTQSGSFSAVVQAEPEQSLAQRLEDTKLSVSFK